VRQNTADLGPIMKNLRRVSGEGGNELVTLLKEVRETNRDMQKRLGSVEAEVARTLGEANKGLSEAENTVRGIHSILSANEDNIGSLIAHLNETSGNLEAWSEDIRLHPWKVIWKADGTIDSGSDAAKWREKGRIGPYGKK
jgi:ABC-type transporter Mla subunit MlaD